MFLRRLNFKVYFELSAMGGGQYGGHGMGMGKSSVEIFLKANLFLN